jgi:hypothetical protein
MFMYSMLQQILESHDVLVTPSVIGEIISNTIGGKISAREINSILVAFGFKKLLAILAAHTV